MFLASLAQATPLEQIAVPVFQPKRALVFELVGPAGAGKSTLLQILSRRDQTMRAGLQIPYNSYFKSAFRLLPTFLRIHMPYRRLRWKEMKRILFLQALYDLIKREAAKNHQCIVLDEGPVYMLARLCVFGGDIIDSPPFRRWWRSAINQWANLVDEIVWLDAKNPVLAHRIRTREQSYPVKDVSDPALSKFFTIYRTAFETVISELTAASGPQVLRFITDEKSLEQIADTILHTAKS